MTPLAGDSRAWAFPHTGALDRLFRALHVVRDRPGDVSRQSLVLILITWVPLALIELVEWLSHRRVALLFCDISFHVRFLVAVPLTFLADDTMCRRCSTALLEVSPRVDSTTMPRITRLGRRLRAAPFEIGLLALASVAAHLGRHGLEITSGAVRGWYRFVALPLSSFLLLRVVWSWVVWCVLLASLARLDLHASALHPDRSGGLRFLSLPSNGFAVVLTAMSCVVSAACASQILLGARRFSIESAAIPFGVSLASALVATVGPLLPFAPQLYRARLEGLRQYAELADGYTASFERRWLQAPADGSVLGSPDIQSLADLASAHEVVDKMRIVPFDTATLWAVGLSLAVPVLPLVLFEFPFSVVLRKLLGLVFGGSD